MCPITYTAKYCLLEYFSIYAHMAQVDIGKILEKLENDKFSVIWL